MGSILLVEADVITSDVWSAAIVASGHAVLNTSGMREALTVVREGGVDVVVIDAYDPRAGVVELARRMNALPDAPPIVLVSESPAAPGVSVQINAATFVPKPCDPQDVVMAIGRLFGEFHPMFVEDEPTVPLRYLG